MLVKPSECDTAAFTLNNCDQSTDTRGKALREEIFDFIFSEPYQLESD